MQIFDLTCLSLTSITFERIELQSSDWTQKTRFFKLYPNMLSVHFDIVFICLFSVEKLKFVFFIDLSCKSFFEKNKSNRVRQSDAIFGVIVLLMIALLFILLVVVTLKICLDSIPSM